MKGCDPPFIDKGTVRNGIETFSPPRAELFGSSSGRTALENVRVFVYGRTGMGPEGEKPR